MGRASMSPRIATTGPSPLLMTPTRPVSPMVITSIPPASSSERIFAAVSYSCRESSGLRWKCLYSSSRAALVSGRSDTIY